MQTPPHAPCSRGDPQQLQLNSSLELSRSLCIAAAGNVQATPVLKSGEQRLVSRWQLADKEAVEAAINMSCWQHFGMQHTALQQSVPCANLAFI
jgi:hypothetical protein